MFDEQTTREAAAAPAPAPRRRSPVAAHDGASAPTDDGPTAPPPSAAEPARDARPPAVAPPREASPPAAPAADSHRDADARPATPPTAAAAPAPVGARVGAYILDCLLVNITLVIAAAAAGLVPVSAEGIPPERAYVAGVISAVVTLAYFAASEALAGRTLGKRLLRCAVVTTDGARPSPVATTLRRVPFVAGLLVPTIGPLLLFAVPLAALVTAIQDGPAARGFHDRLAGTRVVHR